MESAEYHEASTSLLRGISAEIAYNARQSKRWLIFDGVILAICFLLFSLNNALLKPFLLVQSSIAGADATFAYLANCHLNDLLGGIAFMGYVNVLFDLIKPSMRIRRLGTTLIFMVLCGLFWEFVGPLFVANSVGDPLDIVAYALGALIYWTGLRMYSWHA